MKDWMEPIRQRAGVSVEAEGIGRVGPEVGIAVKGGRRKMMI